MDRPRKRSLKSDLMWVALIALVSVPPVPIGAADLKTCDVQNESCELN